VENLKNEKDESWKEREIAKQNKLKLFDDILDIEKNLEDFQKAKKKQAEEQNKGEEEEREEEEEQQQKGATTEKKKKKKEENQIDQVFQGEQSEEEGATIDWETTEIDWNEGKKKKKRRKTDEEEVLKFNSLPLFFFFFSHIPKKNQQNGMNVEKELFGENAPKAAASVVPLKKKPKVEPTEGKETGKSSVDLMLKIFSQKKQKK
jgi:hypothetical protein